MTSATAPPLSTHELEPLVVRAQGGDEPALELLMAAFQPLLRSRARGLWIRLREDLHSLEWADVEAQMNMMFIARLRGFAPGRGVYFAHYMERMLTLDALSWLRRQRRHSAVPFSQISGDDDLEDRQDTDSLAQAEDVEISLSLRDALESLSAPQREAVWLVCVQGLGEADAAGKLGVSRSAIRNRLESGLERLRAQFHLDDTTTTRTGRESRRIADRDFITERITMAKDEKRPDLVGIGAGHPVLLQGIFDFEGKGLRSSNLLSAKLRYVVPAGHVAGIRYLRVGVVCPALVCVSTVVNGLNHRLVPVAANGALHVQFAIIDPIVAGSEIEIHVASEASGTVVIDVGCLQMPA